MSLFSCPLCAEPLLMEDGRYFCGAGHSFDVAAAGYTHLLPPNRKNSKFPGDDKEMVAARNRFLERGYYAPLLNALCDRICDDVANIPAPVLLDSGCGEGYYTAGLYQSLKAHGHTPAVAGVDISKFALKRAAKRLPEGEFAVASVYHLPLPDDSVDAITNVFSPLADEEFARILRPNGLFYYVVPSPLHLWEMKEVLYEKPYENPVKHEEYPQFTWLGATPVRYTTTLLDSEDIMALFGMTPYVWKTPKDGIDRLAARETLTTQIGFDVHCYRRDA